MASLFKHPKSRFWSACYTDRAGRQLKRSTKCTDKAQAMRIALELDQVEKQAAAGAVTTAQLRKILNDVSEKITGDSIAAPSIEAYLTGWLESVKVRNTPTTLERYKNTVRLFVTGLGKKASQAVTAATPKDVEDFLTSRLKEGVAP